MKLKAFRYRNGYIIWCRRCKSYHTHGNSDFDAGVVGKGQSAGGRVAHCSTETSYRAPQYELIDAGPAPEWMIKDYHRDHPKGRLTA